MKQLIWLGCLSYFLIGLSTVIFGTLLPEILHYYGRNYSNGGQLVFSQFSGFMVGVIFAPLLVQRWGYRKTLLLAFLSLFIAHTILFFHLYWYSVFFLAILNGFGFGMAQTTIGMFLLESTENKAVVMSRLEVSFGIGALIMPMISSIFIANEIWYGSFIIVALFAFILGVIWVKISIGNVNILEFKKTENIDSVKFSQLFFFICFIFLYVGIETSVINFLPSIFVQRFGLNSSMATLSVTVFWISMVVGRIFSGVIAEKVKYYRYLFWSNLGALVFLIGIAFIKDNRGMFALVLMFGLFLSGIFAIAIVFANQVFPASTKQTTSVLIFSGGIGGSILPLLIGWTMDHFQVTLSIWILIGCTFIMFVFLLNLSTRPSSSDESFLKT